MIITPDWAFIHVPRCAGFAVKEAYVNSGGSESHVHPIFQENAGSPVDRPASLHPS